jgi:hypothetical protein
MAKNQPSKKGNTKKQVRKQQAPKLDNLQFSVKEERSNRWSLTLSVCLQIPKTSNTVMALLMASITRLKDGRHKLVIRKQGRTRPFFSEILTTVYASAECTAYKQMRKEAKMMAEAALQVNQANFEKLRGQLEKTTQAGAALKKTIDKAQVVSRRKESNVDRLFTGQQTQKPV